MTQREESEMRSGILQYLQENLPRFHEMIAQHGDETVYGAEDAEFLYTLACVFSKHCEILEEDVRRLQRAYEQMEEEYEATIFEMCEKFGK